MSGFWIYQGSHTRVLNISGFWIYQGSEYTSGSKYARAVNKPGFWICQGSEYTKVLNMPPVLNLQGFWIYQGSEYVRVTEDSGYAWIYQIISGWICLDMSAYARICVNMPKSAWMGFVLYFPIVIPCLLQYVEIISMFTQNWKF